MSVHLRGTMRHFDDRLSRIPYMTVRPSPRCCSICREQTLIRSCNRSKVRSEDHLWSANHHHCHGAIAGVRRYPADSAGSSDRVRVAPTIAFGSVEASFVVFSSEGSADLMMQEITGFVRRACARTERSDGGAPPRIAIVQRAPLAACIGIGLRLWIVASSLVRRPHAASGPQRDPDLWSRRRTPAIPRSPKTREFLDDLAEYKALD